MLDPKRPILIEGGNTIFWWYVFATGLICYFLDEGNDRLFRRPSFQDESAEVSALATRGSTSAKSRMADKAPSRFGNS